MIKAIFHISNREAVKIVKFGFANYLFCYLSGLIKKNNRYFLL